MSINIKYRHSLVVISTVVVLVFLLIRCMDNEKAKKKEAEAGSLEGYAGAEKCAGCHKDIYEKHLQTAHHLTSQLAERQYIKGSFEKDSNNFWYTPLLLVSMEKRDSGFYQVVYFRNEEKMAIRFDISIGSGIMGQSFLNWRGDRLYQMPVTYFAAANQWSNSPGFPNDKVLTDRPVTSRCLECHATFAKGEGGTEMEPLSFAKGQIIFGVGCEKCHGPAAQHVSYQTEHPEDTVGKYIVNPSTLTRQQQLDVCAVCHGGKIQKTKPSFGFTAGKDLVDYFSLNIMDQTAMSSGEVEVHGNQYGLLRASKCFKNSELTCNTCHNTHDKERGRLELFSQRCMSCHNPAAADFRTSTHKKLLTIKENCVDCHMPTQPSKAIAVYLQGESSPKASLLRSHFIAVYPEATKIFMESKNK